MWLVSVTAASAKILNSRRWSVMGVFYAGKTTLQGIEFIALLKEPNFRSIPRSVPHDGNCDR
ncbi:hypothetical protein MICAC_2210007 [Microcystis aeruginosa PCC 9443]|uniref:Uncharacterized protein n=1 Tax=Microcystis aeruginosa PCC 9443 TaxID=1160281 RepID=I4G0T6_MICAE|nr:hypothetical protein MICAC_2210007 [Microcystis aeruginosa PCC 9443]